MRVVEHYEWICELCNVFATMDFGPFACSMME